MPAPALRQSAARLIFKLACTSLLSIVFSGAIYCQAAIHVEAYRGATLGIGRITVDIPQGASSSPAADDRVALTESHDRVLYPVVKNRASGRLLRDLLGIELPGRLTFYFMFRGDEPLDLVAFTPNAQSITVAPRDDSKKFDALVGEWWNATTDHYAQVFRQSAYPIVVENYLTATWARRLNREMPEPKRYLFQKFGIGAPWMSQLMANEAYQTRVERDLLTESAETNDSDLVPLPPSAFTLAPSATKLPDAALPQPTEPLATHVPLECFYMRFGNFTNYLWYRDFMRHWQGDIGNMVVVESVDRNISERFQQQIAVGESKLSRVMGPTVVNDVAFIGFDAYLRDGAAMGILFQANNSALLGNNLSDQRQKAKAKHADAVEETLKIADHDVSYIHTPDGRLHSYYAVDGNFHLVTTCRALVERFYQAGAGDRSLAGTEDFQQCRTEMPVTRDDTIFLYAPAAFFQNLASPHYRVELDRRLRSVGEMRAIELARLAAAAEGQPANSIDDLIDDQLLPSGFTTRYDGSKLELVDAKAGEGEEATTSTSESAHYRDTLRGDSGWMAPIPDMPIDRISRGELRHLMRFQQDLQNSVAGFAPICAAIKRTDSPDHKDWDRITADIRVARYSQMPVAKWPKMLGEAQTDRIAPISGDAVSLEIVLDALGQSTHLFGGIRDFNSPLVVRQGEVRTAGPITEAIRAYVGAWPKPHLLDRFLGQPAGPLDADGIARTGGLFDLWFRRADDFFLFSFKRDVLLEVGQQLAIIPAERPAQIRLHVDDLTNKQIASTVNAFGYTRARDTSASATHFMNSLTTQLHIAPEDARTLGESLAGGHFACPLGGKFTLVDPRNSNEGGVSSTGGASASGAPTAQRKLWVSTAPPIENRFLLTVIPTDYQMPLMTWFRGLTADAARVNDELWLNAQLDMVHIEVAPPEDPGAKGGFQLPSLGNLFTGFGTKKDDAVKPTSHTEDVTPSKNESHDK